MNMTAETEWCVVANVKPEAFGRASSPGTRHFVAGAKVWCLDWFWGMGGERLRVLGRHRGSHDLVTLVMFTRYLTNWRAKVAYHPEVVRLIRQHGACRSQQTCEETARFWSQLHPAIENLRAEAANLANTLRLLADEPDGRELARLASEGLAARENRVIADPDPPIEVVVLGDWLEERGAGIPLGQLVETLQRQRRNR
jgi:hypothetical protein